MSLRAFAIDDEPLALRVIEEHARQVPFLELVGSSVDPIAGLLRVQQGDIDLVLLDIQMAALTGIQLMQLLQGQCAIILTTAYPQYALEGYEYAVTDYLLKPISFDRFLRAVQRVHAQLTRPLAAAQGGTGTISDGQPSIFIKTEYRLVKVNHAEILYLEGGKDYTTVITRTEKILTLSSLSKLAETLLQPQFVRVHKSYLVAVDKIEAIERQRIYIGKAVIPIGDTYRAEFTRLLNNR